MIYFGKNRKKEAQEKFPMWKDREISPFKGGGEMVKTKRALG
jgi:hypothetical protein